MVVADPAAELLRLVTVHPDPPPSAATAAERRTAALIRRRFGLALPPPFASVEGDQPVRVAVAADGPAIAAVKWRVFGANYRGGVLDDGFLDRREVVPPASFWTGRAMVPPSPRYRLWVWGRPGTVLGYLDAGPVHPEDQDPLDQEDAGEVFELYVDPLAQGRGGGGLLLDAAETWFAEQGLARAELSTMATNAAAQAFYWARGWVPTGRVTPVDLGVVAFDEVRFARRLR